jgi:hypothetical protein
MNIYLLTQDANREYDTYDACVVAAKNQESARRIRPDHRDWQDDLEFSTWAFKPEQVHVKLLGTSNGFEEKVILASFNAG